MPLPAQLQQTIDQIVTATPDITTELRQPLVDELLEQYQASLEQLILQRLDMEQTAKFQAIMDSNPQPERLQQLLFDFNLNLQNIQDEAIKQLRVKYLGP